VAVAAEAAADTVAAAAVAAALVAVAAAVVAAAVTAVAAAVAETVATAEIAIGTKPTRLKIYVYESPSMAMLGFFSFLPSMSRFHFFL
jgi:hypothetical protein